MHSSECKLTNIYPTLLYNKYKTKLIISGIYNNRIVYIDTASKMVYSTDGQAVLMFRH